VAFTDMQNGKNDNGRSIKYVAINVDNKATDYIIVLRSKLN